MSDGESQDGILGYFNLKRKTKPETIELPDVGFDPVKKIAAVIGRKKTFLINPHQEKSLEKLLVPYFIENIGRDKLKAYLEEENTESLFQKLILYDVALEFSGYNENEESNQKSEKEEPKKETRTKDYDLSKPLELLALEIAGDIYKDFFHVLAEDVYIQQKKRKKMRGRIEKVKEPYQSPLGRFLLKDPYLLSYAKASLPLFQGVEQRLEDVSEATELRHLAATAVYKKFIKNSEIVQEINKRLRDTRNTTKDVLVHTVLYLNLDFMIEMNKEA